MAILAVLAAIWFLLLALAWGDLALRRLDPTWHGLPRVVVAICLGLAMLSYGVLAFGWLGWSGPIAWGALVVLSLPAMARGRLAQYRAKLPVLQERVKYWRGQLTRLDRALLLSLAVIFGLYFLDAFSPIIGWDAATHHYVIPRQYLAAGRVVPVPEIIFGNYPGLAHNLYAWAFALVGVPLAGLFNWAIAVLLAILMYSFGRTLHSRTGGLIAVSAFFVAPTLYWCLTTGYIDLYYTLFLAAALVAWTHHWREGRPGAPILAGILAGCAMGTKHLGIPYLGCLIAGILWGYWRGSAPPTPWRRVVRDVGLVVGIAVLVAAPWYIRAWINSGNPIDPFLPGLFDRHYVPTNSTSVRSWSQPTLRRGLALLVSWPWRFFTDMHFIDAWYRALAPLILALVPLPLFLREARLRRPIGVLGTFVVAYAAMAFVLIPNNTRYAFPAIVALSWIAGMVGGELALRPLWRLRVFPLLFGLPVVVLVAIQLQHLSDVVPIWLGHTTGQAVLERKFPGYAGLAWANANLPAGSRVMSTDPRAYFLNFPFIIADPGNESHLAPPWTLNDTQHILDHLRAQGITHLLLNDTPTWEPEGQYLYELIWRVENEGFVVQTALDASRWSGEYTEKGVRKPYMDVPEARRYMDISRVDILPNADGRGNPGAVVRPVWLRQTIGTNRMPLMQGHIAALQPVLEELYAAEGMRVYKIRWDKVEAGVPLDAARTLTWLLQGLPEPAAVAARGREREAEVAQRIVPYDTFVRTEHATRTP